MSEFTPKPAVRANLPLLIGIAGGTGSGKTFSGLRMATGLAGGERFVVIDTENGRALHYADQFQFDHVELKAPFRPARYLAAIEAMAQTYPVVVVDSFSHEYAGDGGLLDWHEEELQRMAGDDWKKREALTFAAWVKPKTAHKRLVSRVLQLPACHLILCLRAEEKIEIKKNPQTGKTEVVPKRTLAGHVGWIPVAEKSFAYELTTSLVVTPDAPGIPKPVKLQEQHKPFVPLDQPLSEETGRLLAAWAAGSEGEPKAGSLSRGDEGASTPAAEPVPTPAADEASSPSVETLADELVKVLTDLGATDSIQAVIEHKNDREWLVRNLAKARERKAAA